MDARRIDGAARLLARGLSRRQAVPRLGALGLGALTAAGVDRGAAADEKNKRKKEKRCRKRCKQQCQDLKPALDNCAKNCRRICD